MLFFKNYDWVIRIRKNFILISLIFIITVFLSSVSAAELNNDTLEDVGDDPISEGKLDVELDVKEHVGIYGNTDTKLNVHVRDTNGNNVSEGSLTFMDVFDKNYTVNVSGGVATAKVFVSQTGKFNISCRYSGSEIYSNATATFLLNVPVVNTTCHNIVATRYDDYVYFSGNIESDYRSYNEYGNFDDFEEVSEGNVTVYVDGEKLGMSRVDVNGNFVYVWNTQRNLTGQTINFKAFFTNDRRHFNPSNFTKNFTFPEPSGTGISPGISD